MLPSTYTREEYAIGEPRVSEINGYSRHRLRLNASFSEIGVSPQGPLYRIEGTENGTAS